VNGQHDKQQPKKAGATFFFREHVISIVQVHEHQKPPSYDLIDSLPTLNGYGTRTKCSDLKALETLLKYYTTRKFSDSNCNYIDSHKWDENMADFDPRVFQAFVWAR